MFSPSFGSSAYEAFVPQTTPAPTLLDDFDRPDEGPPPSTNWTRTRLAVIDGGGLAVVSNAARGTAVGQNDTCWSASSFGPDMEAFFTLKAWTLFALHIAYVGLRLQNVTLDSLRGYYVTFENGGQWKIFRFDSASSSTQLTSGALTLADGDQYKGSIVGNVLTAYRKAVGGVWTVLGSTTDATYTGTGLISLGTYEQLGGFMPLDDFGGGTL